MSNILEICFYYVALCDKYGHSFRTESRKVINIERIRMERRTARRKVAYRKKMQNRFSMFLVMLVVILLLVVVGVRGIELNNRLEALKTEAAQVDAKIAAEQQRTEEIKEYEKYTQTKMYYEEIAKKILGLVYEDEIIIKEE